MEKKPRPLQKIINIFCSEDTTRSSETSSRLIVCWFLIGKSSSYNLHRTDGPAYVSAPIRNVGEQKIYNFNYTNGQRDEY